MTHEELVTEMYADLEEKPPRAKAKKSHAKDAFFGDVTLCGRDLAPFGGPFPRLAGEGEAVTCAKCRARLPKTAAAIPAAWMVR